MDMGRSPNSDCDISGVTPGRMLGDRRLLGIADSSAGSSVLNPEYAGGGTPPDASSTDCIASA